MKSSIYEFTREDWNTLYPIHLEDHNPAWKTIFEKEKKLILSNIDSKYLQKIEHFGSSSISGIKSKPYIDIFIIIPYIFIIICSFLHQIEMAWRMLAREWGVL